MKRKMLTIIAIVIPTILSGAMNVSASGDFYCHQPGMLSVVDPVPDDFHTIMDRMENDRYAPDLLQQDDSGSFSERPGPGTSRQFGLRKAHKYLGYGTLVLAGMSAVSSSKRAAHYAFSYTATGAAIATCVTGYLKYGRRVNLRRGLFTDDNIHTILGVAGTIGLVASVIMADSGGEDAHGSIGAAGSVSMLISVIVLRW